MYKNKLHDKRRNLFFEKNTPSNTADFFKEKKVLVKSKTCQATPRYAFSERGVAFRKSKRMDKILSVTICILCATSSEK